MANKASTSEKKVRQVNHKSRKQYSEKRRYAVADQEPLVGSSQSFGDVFERTRRTATRVLPLIAVRSAARRGHEGGQRKAATAVLAQLTGL